MHEAQGDDDDLYMSSFSRRESGQLEFVWCGNDPT
jgi:hypothetical protein